MGQLLVVIIGYITILYAVVLFAKRNRHSTDIILAVWLLTVSSVYITKNYEWEICLTFSHCVFLYLYVKSTISKARINAIDLLHFIPFLTSVLIMTLHPQLLFENWIMSYIIIILFLFVYFGASIKLVFDYKKKCDQDTVTDHSPQLSWLYLVVAMTILCHVIKILPAVIHLTTGYVSDETFINLAVVILLNIIGFKAVRLELTFFEKNKPEDSKIKHYSTYNLKESEIVLLKENLRDIMETQKLYLTPDLSLKDLAEKLDVASHHLSFLLNTEFNQNFYEFINTYRLEMAKSELVNLSNRHLSIYAIASDSGFNSQSTFNRFFKQKVGMSPSKYREQYGIVE